MFFGQLGEQQAFGGEVLAGLVDEVEHDIPLPRETYTFRTEGFGGHELLL